MTVASDGDVFAFLLPPAEADDPLPVTGGGEIVGRVPRRRRGRGVPRLPLERHLGEQPRQPRRRHQREQGPRPRERVERAARCRRIEILQDPETTFRFDGSDLMPGAVGADSFWKGIVAWVGGETTATGARHHRVDAGRPASRPRVAPGERRDAHDRGAGLTDPAPRHPSFNDEPGGTMTTADLIGKILQVVMGLAVFAAVVGLLIFFIDKAPKKGRDYWQLAGVPAPGADPRRDRPRLPGHPHEHPRLPEQRGRLDASTTSSGCSPSPRRSARSSTRSSGCCSCRRSPRRSASRTPCFIDKSRGERYYKSLIFMPIAISFVGAGIIWKFVYEYRSGEPRADRPAQPDRGRVRRRAGAVAADRPDQHAPAHRRDDLGADRLRDGRALRGDQGHPDRADRGGAARRHQRVAAVHERDASRHPRRARRGGHDDLDRHPEGVRHRAHHDGRKLQHERRRQRDVHPGVPGERAGRGSALALILFVLVLPIVIYNVSVLRKQREIR